MVWTDCISGVPPLAFPKIRTSVGCSDRPTADAPAAVIDPGKHRHALCLYRASSLFMVSCGPWLLLIVVNPCAAIFALLAIRLRLDRRILASGCATPTSFS